MPAALLITFFVLAAPPPARILRTTQRVVELLNAGKDSDLQDLFSPQLKKTLPPDKALQLFKQLRLNGAVAAINPMHVDEDRGRFRLITPRGPLLMDLALDARGRIADLLIKPAGPPSTPKDRNSTRLKLPFRNEWLVLGGGPAQDQIMHADQPNQRLALDLVMVGPDDKSWSGDGTDNSDYYCYGRDVYAPAPGEVVMLIDGVPDNPPGSMNPYSAMGNCVMIRRGIL